LTIKQKKFADEYIISGNAYQAAIKAGYSENYAKNAGFKMVENNGRISAYIEERMKELEDKAVAKQDEVLKYLTSVMRGEEIEPILINDGDYKQRIDEVPLSAKDRIKAAELLGKRYGTWTDKVDMTSDLNIIFEDDYGD